MVRPLDSMVSSIIRLFLLSELLVIPGVLSTSGDLRLVSYYSSGGGRLEVYQYISGYGYQWTSFCISSLDMHGADLACKKLGYSHASKYATVGTLGYNQGTGTYSISSITCSSSTTRFSSCSRSTSSYCSHDRDLGLVCTNSIIPMDNGQVVGETLYQIIQLMTSTVTNAKNFKFHWVSSFSQVPLAQGFSALPSSSSFIHLNASSLRLLSGSGYTASLSGRLEIFINNTWGTVCDDNFDSTEATVACRQLGYSRYSTYNNAGSLGGYTSYLTSTPIWLDNLFNCNSYSSDLRQCTQAVGVNDCSHSEDIVLTCSQASTTYSPPYNTVTPPVYGDLRLINYGTTGQYISGGRLEMYHSSSWTTFCSTYFNSHEADLACKKIGYLRASNYGRVGYLGYSQGSGYTTLSLSCQSYSSSFSSCSHSVLTTSSCSHYYDVGLSCNNYASTTFFPPTPSPNTGDIRLISYGTSGRYGGRLEMYHSYSWTTFCSTSFDSHEAYLACKKLGFARASSYGRVGYLGYDQGSGYTTLSLSCQSYYSSFSSCSHSDLTTSSCSHYYDVGLTCSNYASTTFFPPTPSPNSGDIRLISYGTSGRYGGRLEMYHSYSWTSFCSTSFDSHEADLACKKLGFVRASSYGRVGYLGYDQGSGYTTLSLSCPSYYSSFSSCSHSDLTTSSCSHYYDVGLVCTYYASTTYFPPYYTEERPYYTVEPPGYSGHLLRLVNNYGNTGRNGGRLEMYHLNSWTTFCSTSFNSYEANLACKKLGYYRASNYGRVGYLGYDQGNGYTTLSLSCSSYYSSFSSCFHSDLSTSSCSHYYDVGLTCSNYDYTTYFPPFYTADHYTTYFPPFYTADRPSSHLAVAVSVSVVLLVLCSALCVGGIICTAVIAVVYRKKKRNSSFQYSSVQQPTPVNYRMSDLATMENQPEAHLFRPISSARSTPGPAFSVNLEHDPVHNNSEDINENAGSDGNISDDEQPLIA